MSTTNPAFQAMDEAHLSRAHWKAWFLSAMGIFLDGFDLFVIAVALPLLVRQFDVSALMKGLIVSAAPIGCILGATVFGRFTDKLGRKTILIIDLLFYVIFAGLSSLSWSVTSLIVFRFLLGIGIGADYPVSSTYITENMPKRLRGKMLVSGFGFQALGMLAAAGLGAATLFFNPSVGAWRWMLGLAVIPAIIILFFRLTLPESPRWLLNRGQTEKAAEVASRMTGKRLKIEALQAAGESSFLDLFHPRFIRRTILTAGAWFIMDIGFYGVHFFLPMILAAFAFAPHANFINRISSATHGAVLVDIFLIIGIFLAIQLVEKWGRIKLQALGFIGMAVGLFVIAPTPLFHDHGPHFAILLIGFIIFNVSVNMGPNPITYLLPAEMFPTHLRATGHGFAAGCAKAGAAVGGLVLPALAFVIGLPATLLILGFVCLLGFILTAVLGFETKGKSLEEIHIEKQMDVAEVSLLHIQEDIRRLSGDLGRLEGALSSALRQVRESQSSMPPRDKEK